MKVMQARWSYRNIVICSNILFTTLGYPAHQGHPSNLPIPVTTVQPQQDTLTQAKKQLAAAESEIAKLRQAIAAVETVPNQAREKVTISHAPAQTHRQMFDQVHEGSHAMDNEGTFEGNTHDSEHASSMHSSPPGQHVGHDAAFMSAHGWHAAGLDKSQFKFTPFGFVKPEFFVTTRQIIGLQGQTQIFILPTARADDACGVDVNHVRQVYLTSWHTHAGFLVVGPEAFGAKPTGDVSAEYYGPTTMNFLPDASPGIFNESVGIFLVHAAFYLEWKSTMLSLGQLWHPYNDPEVSVVFNRVTYFGSVADPMNRYLQIRVTQKVNEWSSLIAAVVSAVDPKGEVNLGIEPDQLQNPYWIDAQLQWRAHYCDNIFMVALDVFYEKPRLFDEAALVLDVDKEVETFFPIMEPILKKKANPDRFIFNQKNVFATKATVNSASLTAFLKISREPFELKGKIMGGGNLENPVGAYAVIETSSQEIATSTDLKRPCRRYAAMNLLAASLDLCARKRKWETGVFFGWTKMMGSSKQLFRIESDILHHPLPLNNNSRYLYYSVIPGLDYTFTVAPRFKYQSGTVTIGAELEYMKAAYGEINLHGSIDNAIPTYDVRFIISMYYNF